MASTPTLTMLLTIFLLFGLSTSTYESSSKESEEVELDNEENCYEFAPPVCRGFASTQKILRTMCDCVQSLHTTGKCPETPKIAEFLTSNMSMEIRRENKEWDFVWALCIKQDTFTPFMDKAVEFCMNSEDHMIPQAVIQMRTNGFSKEQTPKQKLGHYLLDNDVFFKSVYNKLYLGI
ncbi:unnamed protein product [Caenorhabditis angaria]|uniref:DUF19 domain-containing protein n=1 Tax=Caenorhabditis angaria TaxID=860376 RepID=A0A9P1N752_9PELO|nr:unnamed protein product [Caenorhabditis angaria]